MGRCREVKISVFSEMHKDGTRGNRHKLQHRTKVLEERILQQGCSNLEQGHREGVDTPSIDIGNLNGCDPALTEHVMNDRWDQRPPDISLNIIL